MSEDCYLYRHQMYFHTDIHGSDLLLPITGTKIPTCGQDILIQVLIMIDWHN